jgi:hypothetical protein
MKPLHKRDNATVVSDEHNDGERTLLCSNESSIRSPSLSLLEAFPLSPEVQMLDELASILVDYYLELQHIEQTDPQQFRDILSRFDKGAS